MNKIWLTTAAILVLNGIYAQDNPEEVIQSQEYDVIIDSMLYYYNDNPVKALDFSKQAEQYIHLIDDLGKKASLYHNTGQLYYRTSNYDKAINYLEKSLRMKEKLADSSSISNTMNSIGLVYFD